MTEVEFKKRLITDLEDLYDYLREEYKLHPDKIIFKNYDSVLSNAWYAIRDTLPRVLTVEEVKNKYEEPVYIESKNHHIAFVDDYCSVNDCRRRNNSVIIYYFGTDEEEFFDFSDYNKTWRIWNTEPTTEQMKEVPWNCD